MITSYCGNNIRVYFIRDLHLGTFTVIFLYVCQACFHFLSAYILFMTYRPQTLPSPSTHRDSRDPERTHPRVDGEAIEDPRQVWHWRCSSTTCTTATPGPEEGETNVSEWRESPGSRLLLFFADLNYPGSFGCQGQRAVHSINQARVTCLECPPMWKRGTAKESEVQSKRERRDSESGAYSRLFLIKHDVRRFRFNCSDLQRDATDGFI